jgi:hypothetical protein
MMMLMVMMTENDVCAVRADKLYVSHDDRPSVLKPLVDREEAIYYRLDRAREEVASFPVRLFCFSSGVTLIEGKGTRVSCVVWRVSCVV